MGPRSASMAEPLARVIGETISNFYFNSLSFPHTFCLHWHTNQCQLFSNLAMLSSLVLSNTFICQEWGEEGLYACMQKAMFMSQWDTEVPLERMWQIFKSRVHIRNLSLDVKSEFSSECLRINIWMLLLINVCCHQHHKCQSLVAGYSDPLFRVPHINLFRN